MRNLAMVSLLFLLLPSVTPNASGQLLPGDWQKAVVLFERAVDVEGQTQFLPSGTGFLVRHDLDKDSSRVFLITAKHVIVQVLEQGNRFSIRLDSSNGRFTRSGGFLARARVDRGQVLVGVPSSSDELNWRMQKEFDIAAVDVSNLSRPAKADYRVFSSTLLATKEVYDSLGLGETDLTFVIVYDVRIGTRLVRGGMISRMLDAGGFLMESRNFPGDSGSPVVLQPAVSRKPGVLEIGSKPIIIGLVSDITSGLVPIAKFAQTDLLFPQSMDLSVVQPSYRILEILSDPN